MDKLSSKLLKTIKILISLLIRNIYQNCMKIFRNTKQ